MVDRITNLPGCVTDIILSKIPLREAGRTSTLSSEWRDKWRTVPYLFFDVDFMHGKQHEPEFAIDLILIRHRGAINRFVVGQIGINSHHPSVDHWFQVLSSHPLEEFSLHLASENPRHLMPHHLFSFHRLKCLSISNFEVRIPPNYRGFRWLVSVHLVDVHFAAGDLKQFLSKCPALQSFHLSYVSSFTILHLEIDAPNLRIFNYWGKFGSLWLNCAALEELTMHYTSDALWEGAPSVENLDLPKQFVNESNLITVFGLLPSIKKLHLNNLFLQFLALGGVPFKLPNNLLQLTRVELYDVELGYRNVLACILCLIRSSPNLQSLEISSETWNEVEDLAIQYLLAQRIAGVPLSHSLNHVKIKTFANWPAEVEFVRLILWGAVALKKLEIESASLHDLDYQDRFKMLRELASFPRASSEAELLFDW